MEVITMDELKQILEKQEQRLKDILEFYKRNKISKEDEYFTQHSFIILFTLLEINLMQESLNIEQNKKIKIYQYNFKNKKHNALQLDIDKCDKQIISDFIMEVNNLSNELKDFIDAGSICNNFKVSVIDDIIYQNKEKDNVLIIIEKAYNSNFHQFYINYINEIIKLKANKNEIYTENNLIFFKFIKYITQILIFIKLYIKYKYVTKDKNYKFIESNRDLLIENKNLTYFSLSLVGNSHNKIKCDLLKDNENVLDELCNFYPIIMKIIELVEQNLN